METKAQVSKEIKTIVTAGSLSIITKGAVKRSSLIDEKLGIYQRCTATGELEVEENENGQDKRPFYVFIQERSYVQESIGGSFKNIQAFNNFKSLQDAKDYVHFAMCSKRRTEDSH